MLAHITFVLVAAATHAFSTVHSLSLSQECQSSLEGLLTSPGKSPITHTKGIPWLTIIPDAACLNPSALLSFVVGSNSGSIPSTVNTWLTGICSSGSCTNQSISNVVTNLTSGCSSELSSLGISTSSIQSQVISIAQEVYPTVRQVACLKDDTSNQLCAVETLDNLQSVVGQLNVTDLSVLNLFTDAETLFANGVQNIACTDCMKESFSIAKANFPSIVAQAEPDAQALCGASFLDGNLPSTVSQSANDAVFSNTPSASNSNAGLRVSHTALGPAVAALGAIFLVALLG
ncbi:hypothetical protein F5050DRAFT_1874471 [Lentinula boryana]|uniref:Uncharacterized protein n=1 Tax=Lentinula boryana TaxID=40481 RepID=A0ABQ8QT71_9AGAR|nr:hypothetical protein F5050DRAFT_1874471 [Lentinula boryana]